MFLREFFYLHKSDRQVVLTFLLIAVLAIVGVFLTGNDEGDEPLAEADSTFTPVQQPQAQHAHAPYSQPVAHRAERFPFDPNTADSTQLLRLGLQPWQVRNIYKYRAAGGIYRHKEDFAHLYGLTAKEYRELEPYIRISADYQPASTLLKEEAAPGRDTLRYPVKLSEGETVDLCLADTTLLRKVPGIGSYFALRIVQYGERLGGYVSIDQLDEIDDFPMESKKFLTIGTPSVRKLNLNRLSLQELKHHPYLNYYQARDIVDFRRQQGPLKSLADLRLLRDFPPEALDRLQPYVEF
ncbi:MAG: helix-hairpin-helix domain-containing protein [Prevotella sp.]|nr:helix-hairpin-helix domain-containing protein [Prevotella sp.]